MRPKISIVPVTELTPQDIDQVHRLVTAIGFAVSFKEIAENLQARPGADLAIARDGEALVACMLFQMNTMDTPFARAPMRVLYSGTAYKSAALRGAFTNKMVKAWALKRVGLMGYLFLPSAGVTLTPTPRVYDSFTRVVPTFYPHTERETPPEVLDFARQYVRHARGMNVEVSEDLSFENPYIGGAANISDVWESRFKSRFPDVNALYEEAGIIEHRGSEVWTTGRSLVLVGHRTATGHLFAPRQKPMRRH